MKLKKNGIFYGFAVKGSPADCVKIALQELLNKKPDIILSGINLGSNTGINVLYSGTVAAAIEGAFLGIPSAALSLDARKDADFSFAAGFSRKIISYIKNNKINSHAALNVNIPAVSKNSIKGVSLTRQSLSLHREKYERRIDPRGNIYYWLKGEIFPDEKETNTDANLLVQNIITITPITYDLTCLDDLEKLKTVTLPEI